MAPGQQSNQLQAALSGALGPAAQAQAFQNFQESPGQQFLQEQGLRQNLAGAAATGGLGGGQIQQELNRFGQGLAQQDFQNQFNNLGQVTGTGLQAASQIGQLRGQQGQTVGNLQGQGAQLAQGLGIAQGQLGGQQAGLIGSLGQTGANLAGQLGSQRSTLGQAGANFLGNLGGQGAGIAANSGIAQAGINQSGAGQSQQFGELGANVLGNLGTNQANLISGTGQTLANNRFQTGNAIAGDIGTATSNQSILQTEAGSGQAKILSDAGINVGNLEQTLGNLNAQDQTTLMTMLVNLATGQATQLAGQTSPAGSLVPTSGIVGDIANVATAVSTLSDIRLKTDIKKIGSHPKGFGIYTWKWTEKGKELAGNQPEVGVLAQEAMLFVPDAVKQGKDGYLRVNYARLANG